MKTFIALSIVAICLMAYPASATEIPGGYVSGDWYSSGNPYNINGEITVHTDSTLNIHEGVEVIFQGHYKLIVNGFLEAIGTETDSILFTAADTSIGWHSIRFTDAPDSSHLSYCIVQHGKATGTSYNDPDAWGGGIHCYTSSPVITNSTISGNSANWYGGGIYCYNNSAPTISYCTISGNSASYSGGGIFCNSSSPTITNCTISGNSGTYGEGGGICCGYSSPTIINCTISGNSASYEGGGGIYCYDSSPTITNCTISGNSTIGHCGGIYCYNNSAPTISYCTINGNSASYGSGGISCINSSPTLSYCTISGNSAGWYGGGIYSNNSSPIISNCTVSGNLANSFGSGIHFYESNHEIVNTIVEGNAGGDASLYFRGYSAPTASFTYGDLYNNLPANYGGSIPAGLGVITGINANGDSCDVFMNIYEDPLFVDPAGGDYHLQSLEGSYHGGQWLPDPNHSPCIDAGDPTSPCGNEPEPNGDCINMGTYGNTEEASLSIPPYVEDPDAKRPVRFKLSQNYPNPFNPITTISFSLPKAGLVSLIISDIQGRLVTDLVNGHQDAGLHEVSFDATKLASGLYVYRIEAGDYKAVRKMILMK